MNSNHWNLENDLKVCLVPIQEPNNLFCLQLMFAGPTCAAHVLFSGGVVVLQKTLIATEGNRFFTWLHEDFFNESIVPQLLPGANCATLGKL